jgi:hypothetical protein
MKSQHNSKSKENSIKIPKTEKIIEFVLTFTMFSRVYCIFFSLLTFIEFMDFFKFLFFCTDFYWLLLTFTDFYWLLLTFTDFYWRLLTFTDFYWLLLTFTDFYWLLLTFTDFYWLLLTFTDFYWLLMTFTEFMAVNCKFYSSDFQLLSTSIKIAKILTFTELKKVTRHWTLVNTP